MAKETEAVTIIDDHIAQQIPEVRPDTDLVGKAYGKLSEIFFSHYRDALLEAGRYIIKTFFNDDIELARQKKPVKDLSYTQLIKKIQDSSSQSPRKSWLFNAVNLVIQDHDLGSVHTYGQLGVSHKVKLLPIKDKSLKEQLVSETVDDHLTVKQLDDRIKNLRKPRSKSLISIVKSPDKFIDDDSIKLRSHESLLAIDDKKRGLIQNNAKKVMKDLISDLGKKRQVIEEYGIFISDLKNIEKEKKTGISKKVVKGTQEWAVKNVNCCTGCSNACLYCYAKADAVRRKQVEPDQWETIKIRTKDVLKKHIHYGGTVMFPTTHDIVPDNLYACIIVLENLLQAGNKVLVVSKPHLSCMSEIVKYFRNYRNQILFRFSIGAMDNEILKFWEPNAPCYEERKECLELAFSAKFDTSVSSEPMLDSGNIDQLITDLLPFVSNALWIGTMNETKRRVSVDSPMVKENLNKVLAGQAEDVLKAIYQRHKDNPKIKWKDEVKAVVGLKRHTVSGMDT